MAAKRVARQLDVSADYVCADARYLPFRAGAFDTVFSYSVIQHFSKADAHRALTEIGRVLAESGSCLVQMPNRLGSAQSLSFGAAKFRRRLWVRCALLEHRGIAESLRQGDRALVRLGALLFRPGARADRRASDAATAADGDCGLRTAAPPQHESAVFDPAGGQHLRQCRQSAIEASGPRNMHILGLNCFHGDSAAAADLATASWLPRRRRSASAASSIGPGSPRRRLRIA